MCLSGFAPEYLSPLFETGFAFGGSCLPKDLRALLYLARHTDLQIPVLESILPSNRNHIQHVADMILADPKRKKVGIIGLTFKTGTDDLRESPMVELVEVLIGKGLVVSIYDRNVVLSKLVGGNKVYIEQVLPHISAMIDESLEKVVKAADVVVVAHELHGSEEQDLMALLTPGQLVIDLVKMESLRSLSCDYEGICW
jgi:GDP-mannose 6-dehydrogenase